MHIRIKLRMGKREKQTDRPIRKGQIMSKDSIKIILKTIRRITLLQTLLGQLLKQHFM
jgi:hypothetical protein